MAKAVTVSKAAEHVPRKHARVGGSGKGAPKNGRSAKYCKWCKAADGPYTTLDIIECCRFSKDGSPKDKPTKPFDPAMKTWKKTGSGDSSQMAYLTESACGYFFLGSLPRNGDPIKLNGAIHVTLLHPQQKWN